MRPQLRLSKPLLGTALLFYVLIAGCRLRTDPAFADFRMKLIGYDGCTCRQCAEHYGFGPTHWRFGCFGTVQRNHYFMLYSTLAINTVLFAAAFIGIARTRSDTCTNCRYPLEGLPSTTCPECGHQCRPPREP